MCCFTSIFLDQTEKFQILFKEERGLRLQKLCKAGAKGQRWLQKEQALDWHLVACGDAVKVPPTSPGNPGDPEAVLDSSHTLGSLSAQAPVIILPDTTHYRENKLGQHAGQSRNATRGLRQGI